MFIKPVDFQIMIPKMSEVSKISNDIQQKGLIFQQQGNVELQGEIDKDLKQVHDKENVRHGRIIDRQKKDLFDKNNKKQGKKGGGDKDTEQDKRGIDVRI